MSKDKVIIMSFKGRKTVAYTEDGQFIKLPREKHHQVGQILYLDKMRPTLKKFAAGWQAAAAATAVLLIVLMGVFYPFAQQTAEAYLSIGLNKGSIELWLNKDNKVIDIKYSDTLSNLKKLPLNGKDVYKAVTTLTSEANKRGMLNEDKDNLLLLDTTDLTEKRNHYLDENKLKKAIMTGLKASNYSGIMIMSKHGKEFINEADKYGLSASQYYVYERSKNKGLHLTTEELKHGHIRSVLNKVGTSPEELFDMNNHMQQNTFKEENVTSHKNSNEMPPTTKHEAEYHNNPMMPGKESYEAAPEQKENSQMPLHQEETSKTMSNPPKEEEHYDNTESMMQSDTLRKTMNMKKGY